MTSAPHRRRTTALLIPALLIAFAATAAAQLRVELKIPRRMYMAYEPVVVTVSITNLAGREVTLRDEGINAWFGFQISDGDERIIPPLRPDYRLDPLIIPAGQSLKRSVNLGTLFPIAEYGAYRVKANIFLADTGRYFVSPPGGFEISEGKTIWRQTLGVPEGNPDAGESHVVSLLSFRRPKTNYLYARVENEKSGRVLSAFPIGPMIGGFPPSIELDRDNQVHVLQVVGPKTYFYTRVGVNGEHLGQKTFIEVKSRPRLVRSGSGSVEVKGGQVDVPVAQQPGAAPAPKISDRPADMPAD